MAAMFGGPLTSTEGNAGTIPEGMATLTHNAILSGAMSTMKTMGVVDVKMLAASGDDFRIGGHDTGVAGTYLTGYLFAMAFIVIEYVNGGEPTVCSASTRTRGTAVCMIQYQPTHSNTHSVPLLLLFVSSPSPRYVGTKIIDGKYHNDVLKNREQLCSDAVQLAATFGAISDTSKVGRENKYM